MDTIPEIETQDVCASDPNFAVIFAFCERFGNICGVEIPTFQELQEMLEKTNEVPSTLIDLHVKLLRKVKKSVQADKWERAIIKFCQSYAISDYWELEKYGYKGISVQLKLKILKNLLEAQFDSNSKFKAEINKLESSALRSQPLGWDKLGIAYWAQFDRSCNLRVYKEDNEEDIWKIVAKDRSTLVNLINELSGTNIQNLDEEIEDSNSVDSILGVEEELSPGLEQEKDESSSSPKPEDLANNFCTINDLSDEMINISSETTNLKRKNDNDSEQIIEVNKKKNNPIEGETIEESVIIIKGEGTGHECNTGNPDENESNDEISKTEEVKKPKLWSIETICSSSKEVQEEVVPVSNTGFFFGDGSVPCIPNITSINNPILNYEDSTSKNEKDSNEKTNLYDSNIISNSENVESSKLLVNTASTNINSIEDMSSKIILKQSVFNIKVHEEEIQITEHSSNEMFKNTETSNIKNTYVVDPGETYSSNEINECRINEDSASSIIMYEDKNFNIDGNNQHEVISQMNTKNSKTNQNIELSFNVSGTIHNDKNSTLIENNKDIPNFEPCNNKEISKPGENVNTKESISVSTNNMPFVEKIEFEIQNTTIKIPNSVDQLSSKSSSQCLPIEHSEELLKYSSCIDSNELNNTNLNTNDQCDESTKNLTNQSLDQINQVRVVLKEEIKSKKCNTSIKSKVDQVEELSDSLNQNNKGNVIQVIKQESVCTAQETLVELNNRDVVDASKSILDVNIIGISQIDILKKEEFIERNKKATDTEHSTSIHKHLDNQIKIDKSLDFDRDEDCFKSSDKNSKDKDINAEHINFNTNSEYFKEKKVSSICDQQGQEITTVDIVSTLEKSNSIILEKKDDQCPKVELIDKDLNLLNSEVNAYYFEKDKNNSTEKYSNQIVEKNLTPNMIMVESNIPATDNQAEDNLPEELKSNDNEKPKKKRESDLEKDNDNSVINIDQESIVCHSPIDKVDEFKENDVVQNSQNEIDMKSAYDDDEDELNSEEEKETTKKIKKPVGRKKGRRGKAKKPVAKSEMKEVNNTVKLQRKPRQSKVASLIEESQNVENEGCENIRRSRRIAEIKIKEQVLPVDTYDDDDGSKKKKKKRDKGGKRNYQAKNITKSIESDDDEEEDDASLSKKFKKKKRKGKTHNLKAINVKNPWNVDSDSSSSDNNVEEFEDYYHEEEDEVPRPGIEPNVSDHEFSPESDINDDDEEYLPEKRARTAHKKSQGEQIIDDMPCQKCNKSDHPDWILLCDTCNQGWHGSCLRPPLMVIPDGDWYCPPCKHESLLNGLRATLKKFDSEAKKRENEELRRKRLAYVGISLQNVISKTDDVKSKNDKNDDSDKDVEEDNFDESSELDSDSSNSEPLYKLRARRQTNVSYRFNDYDEMINEAISGETDGQDIELPKLNQQSNKNNDQTDSENEFDKDNGSPIAPALLHLSRRKKSKKLTNLDITTDDDSDEDFKGPSDEDDEDEEEASDYSDDSIKKRSQPTRRSGRNRRTVVDPDFINDDTSDESDYKAKNKRKKEWSNTEESEDEDLTWGKRSKKRCNNFSSSFQQSKGSKRELNKSKSKKTRKPKVKYGINSDSDSDNKPLRRTRRKQITYAESNDSEEEVVQSKRRKVLSDDEDEYVISNEEENDEINDELEDIEDEEPDDENDNDDNEENDTLPETQKDTRSKKSPSNVVLIQESNSENLKSPPCAIPIQELCTEKIQPTIKSPYIAPIQETVIEKLRFPVKHISPQKDFTKTQEIPNQRLLLPTKPIIDHIVNNEIPLSSHPQKSPTSIDYPTYPHSQEKVTAPPPTHAYPVPPRLPIQGFLNKQTLPMPPTHPNFSGYRPKIPIPPPPAYVSITQGQLYHAPNNFSYPNEYGNPVLHSQQRSLPPPTFEPTFRPPVPPNETTKGGDHSSEFGGLVSYFSSQQEDDFDA
ncbi:remodeling and spacing factor 1-like isoform X2 [Daktulosphaira vitifoliae]|uniref:remodeling and spacing factor 1-like isoform X2 n=1 Tax=Daktulosphaira vitifoliae TaxID=58002 RepID=UPI0021AA1455|nr:remodeling and spacing factor 1-like isoform X2 [Daktulosphaira vitifoliae]